MSKHFGKTWWGQQWLNALTNIDYSNRLPRGSAYARKGAVTHLSVTENQIHAMVKGSRPKPYNVTIIVPPFFAPDIKKLIKAIASRPVIIAKLLNRELDPEVLTIAEGLGLKVFPQQWTDFKMQCSCPDWAVPCKHLAAVVYKMSAEIDNNPFLVFQLHGVDLPAALKKENIHIQETSQTTIPVLQEILTGSGKKKRLPAKVTKNKKAVVIPPATEVYHKLVFSTLPVLTEPLVQLLADAPVFYQHTGNFRDKYALGLGKLIKLSQKILKGKKSLADYFPEKNDASRRKKRSINFSIDHHLNGYITVSPDNISVFQQEEKMPVPIDILIPKLWDIPSVQLPDYQPAIVGLHNALLMAVNLLAHGAVVPQIVKLDSRGYAIRWLPARMSKEVMAVTGTLETMLPAGLLRFDQKNPVGNPVASHLVSVFLNTIMHRMSDGQHGDVFMDLFFGGYAYAFSEPGEEALPGGIQGWLQRYYLTVGQYKPFILVEELRRSKFQININIEDRESKALEKQIPLQDVLTLKKFDAHRFAIMQSLAHLNGFIPNLDEHINSQGAQPIVLDTVKFSSFLFEAIPAMQLLDIGILLPKALQTILRPKPSVRIKKKAANEKSFMRLDKLLDFDWQVAIGNTTLGEAELKKLLKQSDGLIKYKTQYIYVSPADLQKLHKHFLSSKKLTSFDMLRAALSNDYRGARISLTNDVKELIKDLMAYDNMALPQGLQATLRPYQHRGYTWLYRNAHIGFGSVIADDMGLGKTLQVIATLLKYKEDGMLGKAKALVIAPTGLLTNWQAEMQKFAPALTYKLYHGPDRKLAGKERYDVLLTSYGIVRSDADLLRKKKWQVVITDEAQHIKNHEAAQSKAVKSIPSHYCIAMSGTPVENRLTELWSIMDFCNQGLLGSVADFKEMFANPIQNQHDIEAADKLKSVTAPFLMRRLKTDKSIISDLPDKIEMDTYSTLVKEQAALYEKTLQKAMEAIEGVDETDKRALFVRQGLVLQMMLALKQICNHPTQFLKNKVLDASISGKMDLLFDKLDSIVLNNEKVLIFTQFTEMGNLLMHFITAHFGEAPLFYHGGCSIKQRKEMVEAFQHNPADKIFILSLKAAGTGLNLTAATHVIHYDLWWNPAVEAQATDRAYRIGQKSNVMVHRFITKGTFEERINEMIREKKHLADLTVATGEKWVGNLSNKELKEMFALSS